MAIEDRAAILPLPGDPFLFRYWLTFFDKFWGDEIGTLYVYLNSPVEKPVVDYIRKLCATRPNIDFQYNNLQIEHGDAINRTLDIVQEKYVMLIEDDTFIFTKGVVSRCFEHLESGEAEIVGSKRGSCSQEILDAAKAKWHLDYSGLGDVGPNFWPSLFFCSRQLLESTDRNFGARAWKKGDAVLPLDYVVEVPVIAGDTFVNTSLQLRDMVPESKIDYIPQYHAHPDDLEHAEQNTGIFDGRAPWVHIGSLSSGVGGMLKDGQNRCLARRTIDPPEGHTLYGKSPETEMEKKEWERRVQIWLTAWTEAFCDTNTDVIQEFRVEYGNAINRLVNKFGLDQGRIKTRINTYKQRLPGMGA